jgi:large subunit ribosomal protein L27
MATHKSGGSSKNTTKGNPQYRGIKKYGGEEAKEGNIIVRQCGTKVHGGEGTYMGKDYTIAAKINGIVKYGKKTKRYARKAITYVSVIPRDAI